MKNRISDLRAERAWTQADAALRVSVSRQPINAIGTGKFDPSPPRRLPARQAVRPEDRRELYRRSLSRPIKSDEDEPGQDGKGSRLVFGQVFPQQGAVFDGGLPVECAAGVGEFQEQ